MRFYFNRSIFNEKKIPIYWKNLMMGLLEQSQAFERNFCYIDVGNSAKTCLLYSDNEEKNMLACDFNISVIGALNGGKNNFCWGSDYKDECLKKKIISFLPCVKSTRRKGDADKIIFLIDKSIHLKTQMLIEYLSNLFKNTDKYVSDEIEWANFSDIEKNILQCKKFISFSNNKILNQYFSVLLGKNFILCMDDKSSPLRYACVNMCHPSLMCKKESPFEKKCELKYDSVTSFFRNLITEIKENYEDVEGEISLEMVLKDVERQCLQIEQDRDEKNYIDKIKIKSIALPFSLVGWAENKRSLSELMSFVEKHKDNEAMRKLLLSYLLVYTPLDYWKYIEAYFANDLDFSLEFRKNIELISKNSSRDYIFKWACGTYIRALKCEKVYKCSWSEGSLATCLDFALNHCENEILEKVKQLYTLGKYKYALGLSLVEVFVDNALILKQKMKDELIKVCYQLLDLDEKLGFGNYGAKLFYTVVLYWLEEKYDRILLLLEQQFDGVQTRGFLAKTALFLLKQNKADFRAIARKLLSLEDNSLLLKNPEVLQLKQLAYLILKDFNNADVCRRYLKENKNYFKIFYSGFDKWFLQSCIEDELGNFIRKKRFEFVHKALGKISCIWEAFE